MPGRRAVMLSAAAAGAATGVVVVGRAGWALLGPREVEVRVTEPALFGRAGYLADPPVFAVRVSDGYAAFSGLCPLERCAVGPATINQDPGPRAPAVVVCPCCGTSFSLERGTVISGPSPRALDAYPVRVAGGKVWVTVNRPRQRAALAPPPVVTATG